MFRSKAIDADLCCEADELPWSPGDDCAIVLVTHGREDGVGYGTFGYALSNLNPTDIRFVNYSVIFSHNEMVWCVKGGSVGSSVRKITVSHEFDRISLTPSAVYKSFVVPVPYQALASWELALDDGRAVTVQEVAH